MRRFGTKGALNVWHTLRLLTRTGERRTLALSPAKMLERHFVPDRSDSRPRDFVGRGEMVFRKG